METSIAGAATWRTASGRAGSTSSPTAARPPPCVPINSGCGSPQWPVCPICALRRISLAPTRLVRAACGTSRLEPLKIGAQVGTSVDASNPATASGHPYRSVRARPRSINRRRRHGARARSRSSGRQHRPIHPQPKAPAAAAHQRSPGRQPAPPDKRPEDRSRVGEKSGWQPVSAGSDARMGVALGERPLLRVFADCRDASKPIRFRAVEPQDCRKTVCRENRSALVSGRPMDRFRRAAV